MANQTIKARLQMKADTSANWTTASNNGFIPLKNELIFYTDVKKFKLGDGTQTVGNLDFYEPAAGEVDFSDLTETLTGEPAASKTITAFDQVDGKVSATFSDISITASQVSDFATEAAKYGPTQDMSGYKTTQSAKSFTGSSTQAVSSITQNANGEITSVSFVDVKGGGGSGGAEKVYVTAGYEDTGGVVTFNNLEILGGSHEWYDIHMSNGKTYIVEYNGQKYKDTVEYTGDWEMWSAGGFTLSDSNTLYYSTNSGIIFSIYEDDGSLILDTEMSDTSTNAVQNKVIKAYIDSKVGSGSGSGSGSGESNSIPAGTRNYITINYESETVDNVYLDESSYVGISIEPDKKYYVIYNDVYVGSFMTDSSGDASLEGYLYYQQMDSYLTIYRSGYYSIFYVTGDTSTDTGLVNPDSGSSDSSGSGSSSSGSGLDAKARTIYGYAYGTDLISLDITKDYILLFSYVPSDSYDGYCGSAIVNHGQLKHVQGVGDGQVSVSFDQGSNYLTINNYMTNNLTILAQEVSDFREITCFIEGSTVLMYDPDTQETYTKAIEAVHPGEQCAYWVPSKGKLIGSRVLCPPIAGDCNEYDALTFSNGTTVNVYGDQFFWDIDKDKLVEWHTMQAGDRVCTETGDIVEYVGSEHVISDKTVKHYTLCVYMGKYIVNGIHAGEKREILWPRVNMPENKYYMQKILNEKDQEKLRQYYIDGMKRRNFKLSIDYVEATKDIKTTIAKYKEKINANKKYLSDTDYLVTKLVEGLITEEEYAETRIKRQEARDEINSIQIILSVAEENLAAIEEEVKAKIMGTVTLKYAGKFVGKTRAVLD